MPQRPTSPVTWPGADRRGNALNRRFIAGVGAVALILLLAGLAGVDGPLARWVHASGYENAALFRQPLAALDVVTGAHFWFWLAACTTIALGLAGTLAGERLPLPRRLAPAILAAGLVQAATIGLMILGKSTFGRLRPHDVLASGDWSNIWFMQGGSFPSGHSAFYFGLFLPLAAAAPARWQRAVLIAIPCFVVAARIDMSKHFLSDVSASCVLAAIVSLIAATTMRRWLPAPM